MHIFSCVDCGAAISAPETDIGKNIICENCNTRQAIPAPGAEPRRRTPILPSERLPEYYIPFYTGALMVTLGLFALLYGIVALVVDPHAEGLIVTSLCALGLIMFATGQILLLARQTARNTWQPGRINDSRAL